MRRSLVMMMAVGSVLAGPALAQTAAPPPPPPGGGWMRADTNGDGVVTRAEVVAEAEARFAAMDGNKDGKVTAEEREAARNATRGGWGRGYGMRGGGDGVMTRDQAVLRAGERFDRIDTNRDGKLDAAEIAASRPMRGPRAGGAMPPPPPTPPPAATPVPPAQ